MPADSMREKISFRSQLRVIRGWQRCIWLTCLREDHICLMSPPLLILQKSEVKVNPDENPNSKGTKINPSGLNVCLKMIMVGLYKI